MWRTVEGSNLRTRLDGLAGLATQCITTLPTVQFLSFAGASAVEARAGIEPASLGLQPSAETTLRPGHVLKRHELAHKAMALTAGFEPASFRSASGGSIQLSYVIVQLKCSAAGSDPVSN